MQWGRGPDDVADAGNTAGDSAPKDPRKLQGNLGCHTGGFKSRLPKSPRSRDSLGPFHASFP